MFSDRETCIINILKGKKKPINLSDLAGEVFAFESDVPFDPEITVGNSVRRIIKKCDHHNLTWTLVRRLRNGRLVISKTRRYKSIERYV
jgi:hypothetical protein